ncbi:MAG: glycerol-3-phosphate 1-O-acyltransferase PlsY [Alphaproteobacteria bacterium]|nr:glycerol-3-phosphate 1-O-acyltransferase PlsY [Alphaproteobacteria bacterium]
MPAPISWAHAWPYLAAALAFGYACGAVPFGLLLTRFAGLGDIRAIGSGSIGATNVLRTGRKGLAALTLLFDVLKGWIAVWLAHRLGGPDAALMAGYGAVLGHLFPIWLGFRGGKGVATALGVLLALDWRIALACGATWLIVAALFRRSSLASLASCAAAPVLALYLPLLWATAGEAIGDRQFALFAAIIAAIVAAKHHSNIRRLLSGTEPKIGQR